MTQHSFLFSTGNWLGTGTISFSESKDQLKFRARWAVAHGNGEIHCTQTVELEGGGEQVVNCFRLSDLKSHQFHLKLENAMLGEVVGKGVVDEGRIAWEFRDPTQGFEGFEIYEREDDDNYVMRGEYVADAESRTMIEGKLWQERTEGKEGEVGS